jgi:hypothetical protein
MYVHLYGEYLFTIALGRRGPLHSSSIQTGILIGERGKILILGHYIRNIPHSSSHTADHYTRNMRYKASHILGHYRIYGTQLVTFLGIMSRINGAQLATFLVIISVYGTQLVTFWSLYQE